MKRLLRTVWPYLFLAAICLCLTPRPLQNDTFYLVKIGEHLWSQGPDFQDHFSWVANFPYLYPHFLFNLLCYFFYVTFNFTGLYLLAILLYIFFAFSLFFILQSLLSKKSGFAASVLPFLLSLLAVVLLPSFITARSQTLTYSLFLWELFFLERLLISRKKPKTYLTLLALDSWLIALTHAITWPLFFILFLPFLAELLLVKFLKPSSLYKHRRRLTSLASKLTLPALSAPELTSSLRLLALAALLSLAVGLLTPSRVCFFAVWKIMQASSQSYIAEHHPLTLAYTLPALVPLLIFLIPLIFTKAKLSARWFFLFLGLTVLSFVSTRHVALLVSLGSLPLTFLFADLCLKVNPTFLSAIVKFTPYRLLLFAVLVLSGLNFASELEKPLLSPDFCPTAAVEFIKSHFSTELSSGSFRLFNEYNQGAYLLFNDLPVFIDSRANIYTKPFSDFPRDVFNDYEIIITAGDSSSLIPTATPLPLNGSTTYDYSSLLDFYQPTHFLLSKNSTLAKVFLKDPAYQLLYTDDFVYLFSPS